MVVHKSGVPSHNRNLQDTNPVANIPSICTKHPNFMMLVTFPLYTCDTTGCDGFSWPRLSRDLDLERDLEENRDRFRLSRESGECLLLWCAGDLDLERERNRDGRCLDDFASCLGCLLSAGGERSPNDLGISFSSCNIVEQ